MALPEGLRIRAYRNGDAETLSMLAASCFDDSFVASYSPEGKLLFACNIAPDAIAARQADDAQLFLAVLPDGSVTGFLEMRDFKHISMLFVARIYRGRGIARALTERALSLAAKVWGTPLEITVYAAPGAEPCYAKLGFAATDSQQVAQGVPYTPMRKRI